MTTITLFFSFGIPEKIVSDNRPQFASHEFAEFIYSNDIKHTLVHP